MCFEESKKSNLNCNILILIKINGIIYPIQSTTPWSPQCLLLLNPLTPRYLSEPFCQMQHRWQLVSSLRSSYNFSHPFYHKSIIGSRTHQISVFFTYFDLVCLWDMHPPLYRVYLPLCTPICNGICHPLVNIDPSRFSYNTTGFFEGIFLSLLALKNC